MPLTCCALNEQITLSIANIVEHKSRKLEAKNYNRQCVFYSFMKVILLWL